MPNPSCDQCHRRRLQCLGGKPSCEYCAATGQTCTYSTGRPVGKPKGHRKFKKPTVTDLESDVQRQTPSMQRKFDSTTSDSSPNCSDLNDTGTTLRSIFATVAPSTSPMRTPLSFERGSPATTFISATDSSPGLELGPLPYNSGHITSSASFNTSAGLSSHGAQSSLENNMLATEFPFPSVSGPSFEPSMSTNAEPFVLPPSLMYAYPGATSYPQETIIAPNWTLQLLTSCPNCQQLPKLIASLFKCHLGRHGDFDAILNLAHNALEGLQKSLACTDCLGLEERHPIMLIMLLQQVLVCFQQMLSLVTTGIDRPPGVNGPNGFDVETANLQRSVKISVVQMEVEGLKQMADNVRFLLLGRSPDATDHSPTATLLVALDESLLALRETLATLPQ